MNCYFQKQYSRIYISILVLILVLLASCEGQESNSSRISEAPSEAIETALPTPTSESYEIASKPQIDSANDPAFALKHAIKNLKPGQIVFDVPQSMQINNAQLVEVRLSDDLQRNLKEGLNEKSETAQIKVSPFMKARLEGLNFNIKSLTEESQALVAGDMIQWRWSVTPTEMGEQKLILTLYARIKISNQPEEVVSLKTFERSINVAVSPTNWLQTNGKGILDTAIALSSAGFFAFTLTKWRLLKRVLKRKMSKS